MMRLLSLAVVVLGLPACGTPKDNPDKNDVLAPGVAGTLALSLDAPVHDFATLELRAFPRLATGNPYDLPADPLDPAYAPAVYLSAIEFPYD